MTEGTAKQLSTRRSARLAAALFTVVCPLNGCGLIARQATIAYASVDSHFSPREVAIELNESFIEEYKNRVSIRTSLTVDKAMASPLPAPFDGDLHFAGRAPQVGLPIVAEIANAKDEKAAIELVHGAERSGKPLRVSGVWRIWPEHAGSAEEEQGAPLPPFVSYRPDHVFEIHPIIAIGKVQLLNSFTPVKGFKPGGAQRVFGILEKVSCSLKVTPKGVSIVTQTGLCNDVEFIMKTAAGPQLVAKDGRFVTASALDLDGNPLVERLRMVFVKGTPPEQAARLLTEGGRLHVYGIPRLDFAEISRRMRNNQTPSEVFPRPLPYEIVILGLYVNNEQPEKGT